ncbi:MAG: PAS domain S-box protein [Isosphaeraceae bacterium]
MPKAISWVILYSAAAIAWIAITDWVILRFVHDPRSWLVWQVGLFLILITSTGILIHALAAGRTDVQAAGPPQPPGQLLDRGLRIPLLIVGTLTAILFSVGIADYLSGTSERRRSTLEALKNVSRLKADQIAAWLSERRGDARILSSNASLRDELEQLSEHPDDAGLKERLNRSLQQVKEAYGYRSLEICDGRGRVLCSAGPAERHHPPLEQALQDALRSDEVINTDLYAPTPGQQGLLCLEFAARVRFGDTPDRARSPLVVVLRSAPERSILPLMRAWPSPSRTARSSLVRAADGRIELLTAPPPGDVQTGPSFATVESAGLADVTLSGERQFETTDRRGERLLGASWPVASSPWSVVSTISRSESQGDLTLRLMLLACLLLLALGGISTFLITASHRRLAVQKGAVTASEQRFRTIAEHAADALFITDEAGRILWVNGTSCRALGYSRDEFARMGVLDFDRHYSPETAGDLWREMLADRSRTSRIFTTVLTRKDGSTLPAEINTTVVDWEGRPCFLSVARDLTAQQEADRAIRTSEARLDAIVRHSPIGIMLQGRDGSVLGTNEALRRLPGFSTADELVQATKGLLVDRPEFGTGPIRPGEPRGMELRHCLEDGSEIWLELTRTVVPDDAGSPDLVITTAIDVTARKRAEAELRELNQELERRVAARTSEVRSLVQVIDSSTDFIATATPDGRPIWENDAFRRFAGIGPECGQRPASIADLHPPESAGRILREGIPAAVRDGHWLGETEVLSGDVGSVPVSQLIMAHRDGDGRVTFVSTIMRDISERKRLEATLRERSDALSLANAELARASRLKDEFLASMSHELRTPLNGILAISEALQEGVYGELNPEQARGLRDVEECGRHLLALINDILDVAKIGAGMVELERSDVPVGPACEAAERFVKQAAQRKSISISLSVDPAIGTVVADERRLKQILVNLLSNAVKFTDAGGSVGLEASGDRARGEARFAVWDTGIGISREGLARLFRPFVQLDSRLARQYTGTGLGLALVKTLTDLHGGTLEVESEPGRGSRFTIILPWSPA